MIRYRSFNHPFDCISFAFANAIKTISLLFIIEPIPIETAFVGTSSALSKNRLFALIVDSVKSTTEVVPSNEAPGSLKPICPFCPIPKIWISIGCASMI